MKKQKGSGPLLRFLLDEERGAVLVIVALCLAGLLGISALAVDFGRMAQEKQRMQNAADAAALAAAADIGRGRSADICSDTVNLYCELNGYDGNAPDITIDSEVSGKAVKVGISREMAMGFSSVLTGHDRRTVEAEACAEAVSVFGAYPYAMFAGKRIEDDGTGISISGNNIQINGNIHSNSDIAMRHAVLGTGAVATAVRNISPSADGWISNSIALDMPSLPSLCRSLESMDRMIEFSSSVVKNSQNGMSSLIAEAVEKYRNAFGMDERYLYEGLFIHIAGDLIFNGNGASAYSAAFPIILYVEGDIDMNGAPLDSSVDFPTVLISSFGNITVNGSGAEFTGLIFAPNGDVVLNGSDACFNGMITAQNIRKTGGSITVNYCGEADRFLPRSKVHLID